jgi:uncharacterized protein (DUF1697 family)
MTVVATATFPSSPRKDAGKRRVASGRSSGEGTAVDDTTLVSESRHEMASSSFVALLRGINVGGKNRLPMRDLVAMFERAGATDVRHYIQSGNVVFRATSKLAGRIPDLVSKEIDRGLGLKVPVMVRSSAELHAVAKANPLLAAGADPGTLHVVFLADFPGKKESAALDPRRSPPDSFALVGRDIYLCCPNGVARTKLTNAYFDSTLRTISTGRNWRTVLTLVEMSSD